MKLDLKSQKIVRKAGKSHRDIAMALYHSIEELE